MISMSMIIIGSIGFGITILSTFGLSWSIYNSHENHKKSTKDLRHINTNITTFTTASINTNERGTTTIRK